VDGGSPRTDGVSDRQGCDISSTFVQANVQRQELIDAR